MLIHLTPTLPDRPIPDRLPRGAKTSLPTAQFQSGLLEWEKIRGHELDDPRRMPSYGYYLTTLARHMKCIENDFQVAESYRHDLRTKRRSGGTPYDSWANTPPTRTLEFLAYKLGWRLVPLARWAGVKLDQPAIPRDVEAACRDWAQRADTAWIQLKQMPAMIRRRGSHKVVVMPLLNEAHILRNHVRGELMKYSELAGHLEL